MRWRQNTLELSALVESLLFQSELLRLIDNCLAYEEQQEENGFTSSSLAIEQIVGEDTKYISDS